MSIPSHYDLIVVGAGFYGLTIAHQIATRLGKKVLVLERRNHIGGNAHSIRDSATDIETHVYGSHLFHCNSEDIWNYLNSFTPFTHYQHHVLTHHKGKIYSMPINLGTLCNFVGKSLTPDEARSYIDNQRGTLKAEFANNLEDKAIALIGRPLYEAFIRGYTAKQWQTDPCQLPPEIITRLPVRFNHNTRYFDDRFEGLPSEGYFTLFQRMVDHADIHVMMATDFFKIRSELKKEIPVIYSGPIDRYFDYSLGPLSWRTLDFERDIVSTADYQGNSVINYADEDVPYTRIHEFRHLHPERNYQSQKTVIAREYSRFAQRQDEPYYPVNALKDKDLLEAYRQRASLEDNILFGGRLGSYRYLDMHQAIGAAFKLVENRLIPYFRDKRPLARDDNF